MQTQEKPRTEITPYSEIVNIKQQAVKDKERELESNGVADHYRKAFNKSVKDAAETASNIATITFKKEHADELTVNCLKRILEGDIRAAGYTLRDEPVNCLTMTASLY